MYNQDGKLYFEYSDFEESIEDIISKINKKSNNHLITLYRGGLPLGVRLSNELNLPLSLLDYQRLDGDSLEVTMMKNANISSDQTLILIDDIADEGITITKSVEYLYKHFPNNPVQVYTIFGSKKHDSKWMYTYEHNKEWVVFIPWEGKWFLPHYQ